MNRAPYPYIRDLGNRYSFVSEGKRSIIKIVEFTPLPMGNAFNLGFGDLSADDQVDDTLNSHNGDIIRVISTIIQITIAFIEEFQDAKIYFAGSNKRRTTLYNRIIKNHRRSLNDYLVVYGIKYTKDGISEEKYTEQEGNNYIAFCLKRNNLTLHHAEKKKN